MMNLKKAPVINLVTKIGLFKRCYIVKTLQDQDILAIYPGKISGKDVWRVKHINVTGKYDYKTWPSVHSPY